MKKKLLIGGIAAALALGVVGISQTPVYASEVIEQETSSTEELKYFRTVPDELLDQETFEYGGLTYTPSTYGSLTASAASNPSEVKELILYYKFGASTVKYSTIDFSAYTNLENVVCVGNSMKFCSNIIGSLPSGVNLYVAGQSDFGDAVDTMPFKNVYIYRVYTPMFTFTSSTFTDHLVNSNVENVYYNDFCQKHSSYSINRFNEAGYVNKNGTTIQASLCTNFKYPEEVFYPFEKWNPASPLFETQGSFSAQTNGNITSMSSSFTFYPDTCSEKIVDIDASDIEEAYSLVPHYQYNKIYMPKNDDYNFNTVYANELMISTTGLEYFDFADFKNIKAIRFLRCTANLQLYTSTAIPEDSKLEKIYIPNEYKDKLSVLTSNEAYANLIEYYDYASFTIPTNTYLSDDGNTYGVRESSYSIEQIEAAKETLKKVGLEVKSGDIIDDIMNYYEFPIYDISNLTPKYSLRKFDTVVVPKNMDATQVIEAFKLVIALNHDQMCDTQNVKISYDITNYKKGYNAIIPITVTMPDETIHTKDVTVKVMNAESDKAYILDKKDIYVITQTSEQTVNLSTLMAPIMENYLMEGSVTYTESPILNTTYQTYLAGNSYEAALQKGQAKVVVTSLKLSDLQSDTNDESNKTNSSFKEKIDDYVNNFKEDLKENKVLRISMIILGSVTGILLLWGIWALIRKIIKWLKK